MRKSCLAGLGLAFALTAAIGTAAPAGAAAKPVNQDDTSLEALVGWLSTHELQDWLNYLALTSPPPSPGNWQTGAGKSSVTHAPPRSPGNQATP